MIVDLRKAYVLCTYWTLNHDVLGCKIPASLLNTVIGSRLVEMKFHASHVGVKRSGLFFIDWHVMMINVYKRQFSPQVGTTRRSAYNI